MLCSFQVCVCVCVCVRAHAHACMCLLSHFSHIWLFATLWTASLLCPWDSPGKNTEVVCCVLLQGIFPTQGSNLHLVKLLHCRWILYHRATGEVRMCVCVRVCVCVYTLFQILFCYRLLQDTGYSSLCYAGGPCCSSVLYIVYVSVNHQLLFYPSPTFPLW